MISIIQVQGMGRRREFRPRSLLEQRPRKVPSPCGDLVVPSALDTEAERLQTFQIWLFPSARALDVDMPQLLLSAGSELCPKHREVMPRAPDCTAGKGRNSQRRACGVGFTEARFQERAGEKGG